MSFFKRRTSFVKILRESVMMIIGAILIWRGIWVLLDRFDNLFFEGNHIWSSLIGIVIGVVFVYLADRDLEDVI